MSVAPFRFATQTGPFDDAEALREHARTVERLGYDELYSSDHLGLTDPFIPLVVAAEATTRLKVGPLVLNNEFHHPALLARTALSVDQLTGGRLVLGLGTGYAQAEHDAMGLELRPPPTRVDRFAESLGVLRDPLDTSRCEFDGEHHSIAIDDIGITPHDGHVPLLIGGHGRRVVELAAQFADIYQCTGLTHAADGTLSVGGYPVEHLDQRAGWLTAASGDRNAAIERSALVQFTSIGSGAPPPEDLADQFALDPDVIDQTPFVLSGTRAQIVDKLERNRERLGISHKEGQCLFQRSNLSSATASSETSVASQIVSHTSPFRGGQPLNGRTIRDPDPKTGLASESRQS